MDRRCIRALKVTALCQRVVGKAAAPVVVLTPVLAVDRIVKEGGGCSNRAHRLQEGDIRHALPLPNDLRHSVSAKSLQGFVAVSLPTHETRCILPHVGHGRGEVACFQLCVVRKAGTIHLVPALLLAVLSIFCFSSQLL